MGVTTLVLSFLGRSYNWPHLVHLATQPRAESRLVTPAGNSSAWSMVSNLMVRCQVTQLALKRHEQGGKGQGGKNECFYLLKLEPLIIKWDTLWCATRCLLLSSNLPPFLRSLVWLLFLDWAAGLPLPALLPPEKTQPKSSQQKSPNLEPHWQLQGDKTIGGGDDAFNTWLGFSLLSWA